jgi:hypothetical protein
MTLLGLAWLSRFLNRVSGLTFEEAQAEQIASLVEVRLVALFDVAEEVALANGRTAVLSQDLPLTKGMRRLVGEVEPLVREIDAQPLFQFLTHAGVPGPLDAEVRAAVPRIMGALLLLAARVIAIVDPENATTEERLDRLLTRTPGRPTRWELQRAARIMELAL